MEVPNSSNPRARTGARDPRPPKATTDPSIGDRFEPVPPVSQTADLFGPGAGARHSPARALLDRHLRRLLDPPGREAAERAIRGLLEGAASDLGSEGSEERVGKLLATLADVAATKENPGGWVVAEMRRCVGNPDIRDWWAGKERTATTPGALAPADPLGPSGRARVVGEIEHAVQVALGRPARPSIARQLALGGDYREWRDYTAAAAAWDADHGRRVAELVAMATRALEVAITGARLERFAAIRWVLDAILGSEWPRLERVAAGDVASVGGGK